MPRPRVLSFISQFKDGGGQSAAPNSPTAAANAPDSPNTSSPAPAPGRKNSVREDDQPSSRPTSMIQSYQPPMMEIAQDTLPELQPIFSFLNNHSNKLYQEGYFLKLHDLDGRGRPSTDRVWTECFAQLVGTVLSLWDAAELDAAGEDGEVIPTFINLTDASIKMIESLPMNTAEGSALQNVLSVSTAANNRYLLHFNSLHSLTQWTAGIRLAMYEHCTLQEAYTGSVIAGKGKHMNGVKSVMERTRFPHEEWARVRFGAGTPWRRLWCVITPPDEKEYQKAQKNFRKQSAYDRPPVVKGDIKFYETKKTGKKIMPIATLSKAYAAYAIYPQSKALIDQSTLVKIEGIVQTHDPGSESITEGFLFVMPELHAMVSGFETMLRFLMPVYDTFALYGRPNRLVADVLDTRSLMFAMPSQKRTGFLELIDVAGLIHTEGSSGWTEKQWRKEMKIMTGKRMTGSSTTPSRTGTDASEHRRTTSRSSLNLPNNRRSFQTPPRNGIKFQGDSVPNSSSSSRRQSPGQSPRLTPQYGGLGPTSTPYASPSRHQRAVSDQPPANRMNEPSRPSADQAGYVQSGPPPPQHQTATSPYLLPQPVTHYQEATRGREPPSPDPYAPGPGYGQEQPMQSLSSNAHPYAPVEAPPVMAHRASAQPPVRPNQMPEMRRANSAMDEDTLVQLKDVNRAPDAALPPPPQQPMQNDWGYGIVANSQEGQRPNYATQTPYYGGKPMANFGGMLPNQGGPFPNFSSQGGPFPNFSHPPPASMNRNLSPNAQGDRRLPTIPGTPAVEHSNDFDVVASHPGMPQREPSTGSIPRKPVPPTK